MNKKMTSANIAACITILIWGVTFISTKVLLTSFTPIEILFIRFFIGYIALWLVYPHRLYIEKKQEGYFFLAGVCGVTLYYLLENIALTYTTASNVGVIVSIAPFFTAVFAWLFLHEKRPSISFFIGFLLAMAGIAYISFGGQAIELHPMGDILTILAAIIWAIYSLLTKKISLYNYNIIQTTRRTFFYGLLCMLPVLFIMDTKFSYHSFMDTTMIANLLFLGFGASALCFVTWNYAVKVIGAVKTSVYIYLVPVITTTASMIFLKEELTFSLCIGIVLTMMGLFISNRK